MGLREPEQLSDDELKQVSAGSGPGHRKFRQKKCPLCESGNVEFYQVGTGWKQRRLGRCINCGFEAGWGSFI